MMEEIDENYVSPYAGLACGECGLTMAQTTHLSDIPNVIETLETIKYVCTNVGLRENGMKSIYELANFLIGKLERAK